MMTARGALYGASAACPVLVAEMHDTLAELAQAAQSLEHDSLVFQVQDAIDSELLHDCRRRLLRTKRVWDVCSLVTYTRT